MQSEHHTSGVTVPFATQQEMQFAPASLLDQLTCPPLPDEGGRLSQEEGATTSHTDSLAITPPQQAQTSKRPA
jgi:hypothetical protein